MVSELAEGLPSVRRQEDAETTKKLEKLIREMLTKNEGKRIINS